MLLYGILTYIVCSELLIFLCSLSALCYTYFSILVEPTRVSVSHGEYIVVLYCAYCSGSCRCLLPCLSWLWSREGTWWYNVSRCILIVHFYIFEKCDVYGVDPARISIGGYSFGGQASLYVAFKWRELGYNDKYAPILALTLVYPWVQLVNFNLESFQRKENPPRLISKSSLITYASLLLSGSLEVYDILKESRWPLLSRNYLDRKPSYPLLLPEVDWQPTDSMVEKYSMIADKVLDPYGTIPFQPDYTNLPPTIIVNAE